MAYFDLFLASTTCASLSANYDCASETDAIITGSTSLSECPSSCADVAYGRHGCCEWQADWKKCMFIPGVKSGPSRAYGERHAVDCTSQVNCSSYYDCSLKGWRDCRTNQIISSHIFITSCHIKADCRKTKDNYCGNQVLECVRPPGWCTHTPINLSINLYRSTYYRQDCDGDGIVDPVCQDNIGQSGIISSASGCKDTWPHGTCITSFRNPY